MSTKEELTKQLGKAEQAIEDMIKKDDRIRADLSNILGSYKMKSMMGYSSQTKEIIILSWLQISAEIGKLLNGQKELDKINDTTSLEINNKNCQEIIRELQEKLENK